MSSGSRSQKVRLDDVRKLEESFAVLPEHQNQEIAKTEAIRILLPRIQVLLKRGYSIADVAKLLSDGGVPMTPMLLRTYLGREGGTGGRRRSRSRKRSDTPEGITGAPSGPTEAVGASTSNTEHIRPELVANTVRFESKMPSDKPGAGSQQQAEPKGPAESDPKPAAGKFIPRPDSDDI